MITFIAILLYAVVLKPVMRKQQWNYKTTFTHTKKKYLGKRIRLKSKNPNAMPSYVTGLSNTLLRISSHLIFFLGGGTSFTSVTENRELIEHFIPTERQGGQILQFTNLTLFLLKLALSLLIWLTLFNFPYIILVRLLVQNYIYIYIYVYTRI